MPPRAYSTTSSNSGPRTICQHSTARALVDAPQSVLVDQFNDRGEVVLELEVAPTAVGKVTKDNITKAIVTKKGTVIKFLDNDKPAVHIETPAKNTIVLDDEAQTIRLADQHGNKLTLSKDGITIESAKDVTIKASGNVDITGQKVDIK